MSLLLKGGTVYTGQFSKGKEHGKGVIVYKDGTRFEGTFKNGKQDGPFVEKDGQGNVTRTGTFRAGRLLN